MHYFAQNYDNMETLQLSLEKKQFIGLLQTLSSSDRYEIYNVLKKSLLCDQMENVWKTIDANGLSMDDITEIVEVVRQDRYQKRKENV